MSFVGSALRSDVLWEKEGIRLVWLVGEWVWSVESRQNERKGESEGL